MAIEKLHGRISGNSRSALIELATQAGAYYYGRPPEQIRVELENVTTLARLCAPNARAITGYEGDFTAEVRGAGPAKCAGPPAPAATPAPAHPATPADTQQAPVSGSPPSGANATSPPGPATTNSRTRGAPVPRRPIRRSDR